PHPFRSGLAGRLGLSESQVTVVAPDMGGGFGQKVALLREELIVAAVARHLQASVRWREERSENLMAALHAREESVRTWAAVTRELDPLEVRRINLLGPADFPYVTAVGETYRDITPADTQEQAATLLDYPGFRAFQSKARAEGRLIGLGICNVVESTTYGSQ